MRVLYICPKPHYLKENSVVLEYLVRRGIAVDVLPECGYASEDQLMGFAAIRGLYLQKWLAVKRQWLGKSAKRHSLRPIVIWIQALVGLVEYLVVICHAWWILKVRRYRLLLFSSDREFGYTLAFSFWAMKYGLPRISIPWGFINYSFLVKKRNNDFMYNLSSYSFLGKRMIASLSVSTLRGDLLIYEFGRAFALACFGQLNRRLWIRGGNSDITLLACNAEKEHIDKLDIDSDLGKYFVSVNPSHYTTGCLNENDGPTKKTVVCLPHLYEHKIVETIEIAKSQLDILLRQCILDGYMTKVSLHPVCDIDEYKWIEQELGLEISTLPVEQEIVDADIVVSQPSGCLMYALSNNVKALVLECWNIDFPLEDRLLMKVKKIDEIRHGLAQLACIEGMRGLNTNRNAALDKLIGDMVEILMRQGYVNNRVVKRLRNGLELDRLSL